MVRLGRYLKEFQAIKDYSDKHSGASISQLCQWLGVSRSGYYKWLNHKETTSEETNRTLLKTIKEPHTKRKGILGYRRMTRAVNRKLGTTYNKKRIRCLMRILGISSIIRRSRGYCTKTSFVNIEENILNREFTAQALIKNGVQMWLSYRMDEVVKLI